MILMKKWTLITAILSLLLSATLAFPAARSHAAEDVPPGYEEISQSGHLTLYCNIKTGTIAVKNKTTGYI